MKRLFCIALVICMMLALCACGGSKAPATEQAAPAAPVQETVPSDNGSSVPADTQPPEKQPEPAPEPTNPDDDVENDAWDQLESLGKIETENGLFYVSITMPADFVGDDITQETIDANAGESYTSGKLNDDGSVTYKMTKKQHKAMMDGIAESIEKSLQEMVDSPDYAFTKITHNSDFTSFDAYLSTEEVGLVEGFMVLGFYMYGGMYSIFTGQEVDNIAVNFYSASGKLLNTANSADMQG